MNKVFKAAANILAMGTALTATAAEAAGSRFINVEVSQRGTSATRTVRVDCNTLVPLQGGKVGRRMAFPAQFNLEAPESEIRRYQAMPAAQKQNYLNAMTPSARIAFHATVNLPTATRAQYLAARSDMRVINSEGLFNAHNAIVSHVTTAHGVRMSEINGAVDRCKPWLFNHS